MKNVAESRSAVIDAPLLCCYEIKMDTTEQSYDVTRAFIFFCSFQESFQGTLFSSTDTQMNYFTANSILSLEKNRTNNEVQSNFVSNRSDVVANQVSYGGVFQNLFSSRFSPVVSSKKRAREYYFHMHGYCTNFRKEVQMLMVF